MADMAAPYHHLPMRMVKVEDAPVPDFDNDVDVVRWDLGEDCRITFGRDGESGPLIVYLGLAPDTADLYCEIEHAHLTELAVLLGRLVELDQRAGSSAGRARAHVEQVEQRHAATRTALRALAIAIQRHRLATIAAGLDPEPPDTELWRVLSTVVVPFGRDEMTADEAFGRGLWVVDGSHDQGAHCNPTQPRVT